MLKLTKAERQYIKICLHIITTNAKNDETAKHFDISRSTVDNAIRWGHRNNVFRDNLTENLEQHIIETRKHIDWLISEIKKRKKGIVLGGSVGLSKELRETRILLMELEGLYKHTVNVNHEGSIAIQYVEKFKGL